MTHQSFKAIQRLNARIDILRSAQFDTDHEVTIAELQATINILESVKKSLMWA